MSAGQPNYQHLADIGRLPKDQRNKIPMLAQLDSMEALVKDWEAKFNLAYSLFTSEQKRRYHMILKGEDPDKKDKDEE
ncbi:MAG: hypothetical protein KGJ93_04875 [Patescibacteria group bacterium]|nr:hypothetical protein [Patescibacteria group bacterium]